MAESTLKTELEAARDRLAEILEAHDDGGADLSHSIRTAIAHINHALRDLPADAEDLPEYGQPEIQTQGTCGILDLAPEDEHEPEAHE